MFARRSLLRLSATGVSALGLVAAGMLAAVPAGAAAATTAGAPACATGQLPAEVIGNPAPKPQDALGVYLGHGTVRDHTGFGLAVTHPGTKPVVFTGTITAGAPIAAVKVRDERRDVIHLSADRKTLTYRFVNYGGIDGVAFSADCAKTVTVRSSADAHLLPTARLFLGAHRAHPTSNPFTLERS